MITLARQTLFTQFRRLVADGTTSVAVSITLAGVLSIISSVTLTRLLDTRAYGVVGILTSVAYLLNMISDVGLLNFVARHPDGDDPDFLDQIWTLRLMRAAGLALAMIVVAKPAAMLLGKPEIAPAIAVWSLSFLIDGCSSLAFATAIRGRQFWRLSLLDLVTSFSAFLLCLAGALAFHNYWALIGGMLGGSAVKVAMSYRLFPAGRRRFVFDRARARELWRYSRNIAASSLLSLFIMQSDRLMLARMMPLVIYGRYAIAVSLTMSAGYLATPYAQRVLSTAYSKAARGEPGALRRIYYSQRRFVTLGHMASVGGMIGSAPLIIAILYDPRYSGVVPFFQLLLIGAALRIPVLAANQAMFALGNTRSILVSNIVRVIWLAAGGLLGLGTGNYMWIVVAIGTIEAAALVPLWRDLRQAGLLNLKEEAYGFVVVAASAGLGLLVSRAALALLPGL